MATIRINPRALEAATKAAFESGPDRGAGSWDAALEASRKVSLAQAATLLRAYEDAKADDLKARRQGKP